MTQTPDDRTAVFTGTFDPLTLGHLDVIRRGRLLFDRLVVGIGLNPNKQMLFTIAERVAVGGLPVLGPRVMGLLALFVRLAIGLCLLNIGLATVMASVGPQFGGPGMMGGGPGLPGIEMLVTVLPYLTLAIGVGLVF